jgi:hypothetical protein
MGSRSAKVVSEWGKLADCNMAESSPRFGEKQGANMRSALAAIVLLFVSSALCSAQNAVSRQFLAFTEAQRNAGFTAMLRGNNEHCDVVVRTQYNGSAGEIDEWEAKCRDGNMYSFSIPPNVNETVKVLSCKELRAFNIMMGAKREPLGCQMK